MNKLQEKETEIFGWSYSGNGVVLSSSANDSCKGFHNKLFLDVEVGLAITESRHGIMSTTR